MINANDGGGSVTFNGGETWSTLYNQPTGQFYRLITDNGYPYRIYSGQQDNSTIAIDSRVMDEWHRRNALGYNACRRIFYRGRGSRQS